MGGEKYKQKHKELGLCTQCSNPVYPGKINCPKHLISHRISNRDHYQKNSERIKEKTRNTINELKKKYICVCRTPLTQEEIEEGYVRCINCRLQIFKTR